MVNLKPADACALPSLGSYQPEGLDQDLNLLLFLPFETCPSQLIVNDKSQNLRRLQAQRNELNAKGEGGREERRLGVGSWSDF